MIAAIRGVGGSARSPTRRVPSDAVNPRCWTDVGSADEESLTVADGSSSGSVAGMAVDDDKLPIKMLNDRVLVRISDKAGERKSSGGIVIPATAQVSKRLIWATVVAQGQNVRSCEVGDKVLFSPEDRYEVEVQGEDYVMLRERELHAVAAERIEASTGLYL
jgi:chaperonin GroES